MHDDVTEIDEHPFTAIFALGRNDLTAGFANLVLDVARKRANLPVGVATGDDDALEERCQLGGVDDFDITTLDVLKGIYDDLFKLCCIHWRINSPSKGGVA